MKWYAIDVTASAPNRDVVAAWLVERTGQAVEERADGTLVSFARDASEADALVHAIEREHGSRATGRWRELPEVDWSERWREGLAPRRFEKITVTPSWVDYHPAPGEPVIVLDPENAFGSGEHGSTRAAMRLLEQLIRPGDFVLDLGSGSGILTVAARKLGARKAIGIEQDDEAIEVAIRNAARNAVADAVDFFPGDAGQLTPLFAPVDLVVSNILRIVNIALLPEVWRTLRPGGIGIFSGMEVGERELFLAELERGGFEPGAEIVDSGWWAVAATRP